MLNISLSCAVALGCAFTTVVPLRAQTPHDPSTIVTSGFASRALPPDKAKLQIGIEVHAGTASSASTMLNTRVAAVRAALSRFPAPLDSVATVGFNVGPNYNYDSGKKLVDYQASAVLQVSLRALDRLGQLVDSSLGAGATDIAGVRFESDSAPSVRRTLLAEALAEARNDAAALAAASGAELGRVLTISTSPLEGFRVGANGYASAALQEVMITGGGISSIGPRDVIVKVEVYTSWQVTPLAR